LDEGESARTSPNTRDTQDDGTPIDVIKMYHGTSMSKALSIEKSGFRPSTGGELGPGVYMVDAANKDKAIRFAHDEFRRANVSADAEAPALLECELRIRRNLIFHADSSNQAWQSGHYDACLASRTALSKSSEWCVKRGEQIRIVQVTNLKGFTCPWSPSPCPYEERNARAENSPWGGRCPCAVAPAAGGSQQHVECCHMQQHAECCHIQ